jgi:hypothetical protein
MKCFALFATLLLLATACFAQLAATPTTHGIDITWTLSNTPGVTSQLVCRSTVSGGENCGTPLQTFSDDTTVSFLDTGGVAGTKYYYVLEACIGTICSSPTTPEVSAVFPTVPNAQTGVGAVQE